MSDQLKFKVVDKSPEKIAEKTNYGVIIQNINNYGNVSISGRNQSTSKFTINFWKLRGQGFAGALVLAIIVDFIKQPMLTIAVKIYLLLKGAL